ncbi:MAG: hypothetical protein QOF16_916 [Actinomycetota bacterium]|nr:hypothetical protein [Actinomycetota bacterium]
MDTHFGHWLKRRRAAGRDRAINRSLYGGPTPWLERIGDARVSGHTGYVPEEDWVRREQEQKPD